MKEPIKVLHVFGFFDKGGAESMVMNLFNHIDRNKVEFGFVVHGEEVGSNEKAVLEMGAEVFHVPNYTGKNHYSYKRNWERIFEENPGYTIIHSHVRSTANIYLKIAQKYGLKTIAHSHNTSSGSGFSAMVKNVYQKKLRKYADEFIGCSQEAGEWLFGKKICNQDNFHILNNAIDAREFAYNESVRQQTRRELGIEDKIVIGHVGRFHEQKNHSFLIDIFFELQKQHEEVVLLLVGEGDRKRKQLMEQKVENLGIEDKVQFLGLRSDIKELLQAFDLFLFPSLFEGLPVTLVETQAAGLPAVVTDNVSREIELTDLISYVSLNKSAAYWAEIVWENVKHSKREQTTARIQAGNYDIETTSTWYEEYIIHLNEMR